MQVYVLLLFTLNMAVTGFHIIKNREMAYDKPVVLGCIDPENTRGQLTFFEFTEINVANAKEFTNFFDKRPISVYFIGYGDKLSTGVYTWAWRLGSEWSHKQNINVCFSQYASTKSGLMAYHFYNYTIKKRLPFAAKVLAMLLVYLKINEKITAFTQITFVGFCMGNALGVMVAKLLENHTSNATKTKIGRFFALDPAGVGFRLSTKWRVKKGVADYTEVMRTTGFLGPGYQRKHADANFVVNNGWVQPKCSIFQPYCSHTVSQTMFDRIIFGTEIYVGKRKNEECVFGPYKENRCKGTFKIIRIDETRLLAIEKFKRWLRNELALIFRVADGAKNGSEIFKRNEHKSSK